MQQLARRQRFESPGLEARRRCDAPAAPECVLAGADKRTTDVRQVHANLMGPSRAETDAQQIGMVEARDYASVRYGVPAALRHRHAFAFLGMARDRRFDVNRALAQV